MRLTDEQVASYQRIYLETFGKPISKADALVQALALVRLVAVLSKSTNMEHKDDRTEQRP